MLFLIGYVLLYFTPSFVDTFMMMWFLWLGVVAFIVCVIKLRAAIPKNMSYLLSILALGGIIIVIFAQVKDVYGSFLLSSIVLT